MNKKILYQYFYQPKGVLKGVVAAVDKEAVGWSLCHDNDYFSKTRGLHMAAGRGRQLASWTDEEAIVNFHESIPQSLRKLYSKMVERSIKYYKDK